MDRSQNWRQPSAAERREMGVPARPRQVERETIGLPPELAPEEGSTMEHGAPRAKRGRAANVARSTSPRQALLGALRSPAGIRQAMLLREVLGPPKALQQPDGTG